MLIREVSCGVGIDLPTRIEDTLNASHGEAYLHTFVEETITNILPEYVRCFSKVNVSIGNTKYPDLLLETHAGYLDVLEIKRIDTPLLWYDESHDNYCWDRGMTEAISQIAHYLHYVQENSLSLRDHLRKNYKADVEIVKPRGIILAGDMRGFSQQKKYDFWLLAQQFSTIRFITYDELLTFSKK